jgi:polar amino acid transport system substrate-binding protein/arginine/ornithine transport system substrate-binding protein
MKNILMTALAASALAGQAIAEELDICVEGAYPPFSETAADGSVVGFDIDIANALCAEMGNTCTMVKTDWDGIIPALVEGKCDAIIASMTITEERKQIIDFSGKYYNTEAAFVGKEGATVESLKKVGVQRGTTHQNFMEGEFPDVELVLYGTQDEVYLDLVAGRIDASMADSLAQLEGFLKTDAGQGFAFVGEGYSDPKYHGPGAGIGVRQEDVALRDGFTAAIAAIRASGQYDEIQKKYFDIDIWGGD